MGKSKAKRKRKKKGRHVTDIPLIQAHLDDCGASLLINGEAFGFEKMSDVLSEFVRPYVNHTSSEREWRRLLPLSFVAWNAALLPWWKRTLFVRDMVENVLTEEEQADAHLVIRELTHRKKKYFADCKRLILGYDLTMTKEGPYLKVISSVE